MLPGHRRRADRGGQARAAAAGFTAPPANAALKPVAALAITGAHEAWLVPLAIGLRLALASVVALVMVLGVGRASG